MKNNSIKSTGTNEAAYKAKRNYEDLYKLIIQGPYVKLQEN